MTRAWKLIKWISKNIIIPVNNRRPGLLLRTFVLILFFFFNYFAEPIQYTSWEEILLLFREGEKESARQRASWNCNCSQAAGASLHADPALVLTQHLPHGTLCPPLWAVAKGGSMSPPLWRQGAVGVPAHPLGVGCTEVSVELEKGHLIPCWGADWQLCSSCTQKPPNFHCHSLYAYLLLSCSINIPFHISRCTYRDDHMGFLELHRV